MITMSGKAIRRWWALFALPTFAAFVIGFLVPFAMGVYLSFCKFSTVTDATFVGVSNYQNTITDPEFLHALVYTILFTIVTTVVINVVAFAIAYMLTKAIKGSTLFRSVFFMPNLIGGIILGYIWLLLLNGVLAHWGRSITFSGAVDGANSRQTLFNVTIPLMMPSITVCTFLTVTNGFKMFDQNLALTNGAPSNSSELLALNIYRTFYGRAGFKAVVFFIIVAVIALIQNKLTTSKEVQA